MIIQAMPYPASAGGGGSVATITIASGAVASNLTNYPVYVNLADMPSGFWSGVASDGHNIRVKQAGSDIPFDLVKIDTTGQTGTLFFKAASLLSASSNVFTVDLSGAAAPAVTDANGRNAVWSAFDRVFSFEGSQSLDRCGSGSTPTLDGGATVSGGVLTLDGVNDVFRVPCGQSTTFSLLVSSTYNGGSSSHRNLASYMTNWAANPSRAGVTLRAAAYHWSTWAGGWLESAVSPTIGNHYNSAVTYAHGGNRVVYADGVPVASGGTSDLITSVSQVFALGAEDATLAETYAGTYTFAALALSELSADFIAAWHSNRSAPASFYAIS
jgi:hypothetical protein